MNGLVWRALREALVAGPLAWARGEGGGGGFDPPFRPPAVLLGPHAQTLAAPAAAAARVRRPAFRRQVVAAPGDGQPLALDWAAEGGAEPKAAVVFFHGIGGDSGAPYLRPWLAPGGLCERRGWAGVVYNRRGHAALEAVRGGGADPRFPSYGGGPADLADAQAALDAVEAALPPGTPLLGVGFSAGAPHLVRCAARFRAVACLSFAPDLEREAEHLRATPHADRLLLEAVRGLYRRNGKEALLAGCRGLTDLDAKACGPLHGARCVGEFYRAMQAADALAACPVPALVLASRDDPLLGREQHAAAARAAEANANVTAESTERGGHCGWVDAAYLSDPRRGTWADRRAAAFLQAAL